MSDCLVSCVTFPESMACPAPLLPSNLITAHTSVLVAYYVTRVLLS